MIWSFSFSFLWSLITQNYTVCLLALVYVDISPFFWQINPCLWPSVHAPRCTWWSEMKYSFKVTMVQQSRAINNSSGNPEVPKPQLKYQHVEQELLIILLKMLPCFCTEVLREHGSNVFCPAVFVSTLCCCAKWLHTCSQKRPPLYSLLLYAAGKIELYQIKLFGLFFHAAGNC